MRLDIAVIGARRPRYLYVCLDALFRMRLIENSRVYVYIDGTADEVERNLLYREMVPYIDPFPVTDVVFHPRCLGVLEAHTEAIRQTFEHGCESVLYVEDDLLLGSDAVEYLYETMAAEKAFFYSLVNTKMAKYGKRGQERLRRQPHRDWDGRLVDIGYNPLGVVIHKADFEELSDQIDRKKYLELPWQNTDTKIGDYIRIEMQTHDAIFRALAIENGWEYMVPVRSRLGHFGVCNTPFVRTSKQGMFRSDKLPANRAALEAEFFAGPREGWRDNICTVFRSDRLCDMEYAAMIPFYWEYQ